MYDKSDFLPRPLREYLGRIAPAEPEIYSRVRNEPVTLAHPTMQIASEQFQFMGLLVRAMRVRRALEIGVFTGSSALAVALALPEDGELTALDASEEFTSVARRYWNEAGVAGKIDLRIGPALDSLDALRRAGRESSYDLAFIDADKVNYDGYYEHCLRLLRPGGVMALDNIFQDGGVYDESNRAPSVQAIRAINDKIRSDDRVMAVVLPLADGVTLALKK